jgi:hypothetical protein
MKVSEKLLIVFSFMLMIIIFGIIHFMPKFNINNRIQVISKVISAEACGEGKIGMYMVANTIVNRARLNNKSPYDIVTEPNQYAGLNNVNADILYQECGKFSDELVANIFDLPDLTDGALYFKRPEEEKKTWHKILTIKYKNHEFWK